MIKKVIIEKFKSIERVDLNCRRVNVFIGKPNVGKSNILESLGLLSFMCYGRNIKDYIRFQEVLDLFNKKIVEKDHSIKITIDDDCVEFRFCEDNLLRGYYEGKEYFALDWSCQSVHFTSVPKFSIFKFYRFKEVGFNNYSPNNLSPPVGDNLLNVTFHNKNVREIVGDIFKPYGIRLVYELYEQKLKIKLVYDDVEVILPYTIISDTLRRIVFELTVIESNNSSVIMLEEPEAHSFPYYTKYIAECIGLDNKKNQFFITTHNPYFIESLIEKTNKDELAIFVTYMKNNCTKIYQLNDEDIKNTYGKGLDLFFNVDGFEK